MREIKTPHRGVPRPAPARRAPRPHVQSAPGTLARLRAYDEELLRRVTGKRHPATTFLLAVLCRFADPDVVTMALVVIALGGSAGVAEHLCFALVTTAMITQTVKNTVRRARPHNDIQALVPPDRYSFPSGHTAAAFTLAMSMTAVVPELVPIAILVAFVVGYARLYLGVHYPIDVVCGSAIGLFTGSIVALIPPVSSWATPLVEPIQAIVLGLS
jgi:undecaprenyl-diphosphatase